MKIYCASCNDYIEARLTDGKEIYPHRPDLAALKFWKCDGCSNYVGTHKNSKAAAPLGSIASPELKKARQHIHRILEPIWKSGRMKRSTLYGKLTKELGWKYHTANIRSIEEARKVYRIVQGIQ